MTAADRQKRPYDIAKYEIRAETPEVRLLALTLAAGQEVPWHWHSHVSDTVFCMEGPMAIETRAPRETVELLSGGMHVIPPKRAHRVAGKNKGPCKFAAFEGVGVYDFNLVGG